MEETNHEQDTLDIFGAAPADSDRSRQTSPEINLDDFDKPEPNGSLNGSVNGVPIEPDQKPIDVKIMTDDTADDQPAEVSTIDPDRETELSEKAKEVKASLVRLIKPSRIVSFWDMMASRTGAMVLKKSNQKDWRLEEEEKEFLADVLDVMIEEEGIEFWPAKVWLILGLLFFYGMKTNDVWGTYYTAKGIQARQPEIEVEEWAKQRVIEEAELTVLEGRAEMAEKRAKVMKRIKDAEDAIAEGMTADQMQRLRDQEYETEDDPERELAELRKQYPPDRFVWDGDELVKNKDGSPRKRPDFSKQKRYKHPKTGAFISKQKYEEIMAEQDHEDDPDHDQETEDAVAEVVE